MTICGCWEHYHPPPQVYDPATDLQMIRHEVEEILRTQQAISSRLDRLAAVTPGVRELRAGVQPSVPRTHESRFRVLEFPAEEETVAPPAPKKRSQSRFKNLELQPITKPEKWSD